MWTLGALEGQALGFQSEVVRSASDEAPRIWRSRRRA